MHCRLLYASAEVISIQLAHNNRFFYHFHIIISGITLETSFNHQSDNVDILYIVLLNLSIEFNDFWVSIFFFQ